MGVVLAILTVAYASMGVAFGLFFALRGAAMLDDRAAAARLSTRLIWLPGAAGLWPLLAMRCWNARRGRS